jgi:hypothetical protein
VASKVLDKPYKILNIFDTNVMCEHPFEIIAKKIKHRHETFAVRDFFDLATVYHHANESSIKEIQALLSPYTTLLQEKLQKIPSFDEIQVLPQGKIIQQTGKEILLKALKMSANGEKNEI